MREKEKVEGRMNKGEERQSKGGVRVEKEEWEA